jgi:hypothetical protein
MNAYDNNDVVYPTDGNPDVPEISQPTAVALYHADMSLATVPEQELKDATEAAKALQQVIAGKKNPVKFNGEQYLEFEDWQTVGRFYGITAKVIRTQFVEYGDAAGFEAFAVAVHNKTGIEVSACEAICLNDEKNWQHKPLFQLKSMAQTRACSKALRQVLGWVVVLAGYKATPGEEIRDLEKAPSQTFSNGIKRKSENSTPQVISEAQRKRLYAIYKGAGVTDDQMKDYLLTEYNIESAKDILKADYEAICIWAQGDQTDKTHGYEPGMDG